MWLCTVDFVSASHRVSSFKSSTISGRRIISLARGDVGSVWDLWGRGGPRKVAPDPGNFRALGDSFSKYLESVSSPLKSESRGNGVRMTASAYCCAIMCG
jgi:hypothetical protein